MPPVRPPAITLTTDYGTSDHLVGTMKGAILKILPEAQIVDICNHVKSCDILDGALTIGQAWKYFPPKTIHVVVVDPGVGTQRRPILVSAGMQYFIAPDNGVLSMIYEKAEDLTVRHVTAEHYFLTPLSNTFHGRDIFAPVAAWLAKTGQPSSFGDEVTDFVRFTLPKPKSADGAVRGVVLKIDNFGNLLTNFSPDHVPQLFTGDGKFKMTVGGKEVSKVLQNYSQGQPNEAFVILGSSGLLEVAMNRGNAAHTLGVQRGAEVIVTLG
jgi:S-adenosylmethionine hydrolase